MLSASSLTLLVASPLVHARYRHGGGVDSIMFDNLLLVTKAGNLSHLPDKSTQGREDGLELTIA
jgi:hypothetical protein